MTLAQLHRPVTKSRPTASSAHGRRGDHQTRHRPPFTRLWRAALLLVVLLLCPPLPVGHGATGDDPPASVYLPILRTRHKAATSLQNPVLAFDPADGPLMECVEHDIHLWHALIDGKRNCHYDHEHKDDPAIVDLLFGPVGAGYGGQQISYPWQTFSASGTENQSKHGGYGWLVRTQRDCVSRFTDGCIRDFRAQYHAIMSAQGATIRFHSFWLEARGCLKSEPTRCGIIRTGGWIDYNHLVVDGQRIPLPNDAEDLTSGSRRIHYFATGNPNFGTWYGANHIASIVPQTGDMWGYVSPDNPTQLHLFCPDLQCANNGSTVEAHVIQFIIPARWDTDQDGRVTLFGYTDRFGNLARDCSQIGLDCIPLEIVDMPVGIFQYRDDDHGLINGKEYDTSPGRSSTQTRTTWCPSPGTDLAIPSAPVLIGYGAAEPVDQ